MAVHLECFPNEYSAHATHLTISFGNPSILTNVSSPQAKPSGGPPPAPFSVLHRCLSPPPSSQGQYWSFFQYSYYQPPFTQISGSLSHPFGGGGAIFTMTLPTPPPTLPQTPHQLMMMLVLGLVPVSELVEIVVVVLVLVLVQVLVFTEGLVTVLLQLHPVRCPSPLVCLLVLQSMVELVSTLLTIIMEGHSLVWGVLPLCLSPST